MSIVVPLLLLLVFARAIATKTNVYHSFVEGAKQGLPLAKSLLPYLACMLIARVSEGNRFFMRYYEAIAYSYR